MDLKALLQPGGDPLRPLPCLMLFSLLGASGPLVVAIQYRDYLWAAESASFALVTPVLILAIAWTLWGIAGARLPAAFGLGLAVVAGCLSAQALMIFLTEQVLGFQPMPGKGYLYRLGHVRGPLLWWGIAAAAWYTVKRAERRAEELGAARLAGDALQASTAEARLQALQAQVEPHFLFNTLAHVKWLYRRDPERGRRMLDRLLTYLQAALPRVRQASTTLEQELQLTHAYLDIQQLRIGGRL